MEEKHPTILDRTKSTTIDTIIIITFMWVSADIIYDLKDVPDWVRMVLFLSILLYEPVCTAFGATLGNHKMGIRVRRNSDITKRIGLFQAILRFFIKFFFGWFSFISIFTNTKKRAIHDLVSGSVMIKID